MATEVELLRSIRLSSNSQFGVSVAGEYLGRDSIIHYMLGQNINFQSANVLEDICEFDPPRPKGGGDNYRIYTPEFGTFDVEVVSTDANDNIATVDTDAGVKTVRIHYLDENWVDSVVDVDLNGTNPVPALITARRINDFHSVVTGEWGVARGSITLRTATGATIESPWTGQQTLRFITQSGNKDMTALYTVPHGKKLYADGTVMSSANADISMRIRSNTDPYTRELVDYNCFLFQSVAFIGSNRNVASNAGWLEFPAKADIKISGSTSTSGDCSCHMVMVEIEDEQ